MINVDLCVSVGLNSYMTGKDRNHYQENMLV